MLHRAERLEDVDDDLVRLIEDVGSVRDVVVIQGSRTIQQEETAIAMGFSRLTDPTHSKHVIIPGVRDEALAVDLAPYPINWQDVASFARLGAFMKERAAALGIVIVWGGDWAEFKDWGHFERVTA